MEKASRILHYPGSKWSLADWIISHMPPHSTYLEPFFGSGAVFFNKQPAPLETINDLDGDVVNFFRMIRDRPEELARLVYWTPYSRQEYYNSYQLGGGDLDELERARRFLVRCWMAIGSKSSERTGWRSNIELSKSPHLQKPVEWNSVPERILKVAERLKQIQIENRPALELIQRYRLADVLIYADPPYPLNTRRGRRIYRQEMNDQDHKELLEALDAHPGPVLLSGYANELYDARLRHWHREERQARAEAGQTRTEVLWINPVAAEQMRYRQLELELELF